MRRFYACFCALVLFFGMAMSAGAAVITFDDLTSQVAVPTTYNGFTWDSNFYVYDQASYQRGYGNPYPVPSPQNAVYNAYGVTSVTLTAASPFLFNGAYFTEWANNNQGWGEGSTTITVQGYNNIQPCQKTGIGSACI